MFKLGHNKNGCHSGSSALSGRIFSKLKKKVGSKKDSCEMAGLAVFFLFFIFFSLLSACGGVPETYYYTLAFEHDAPRHDGHAPLPFALGVEKFQSEVIYDDDRIIYRDSPFEVKYYFYRRWVAPPRHLVTEKVLSYLSDRGLFEKVTTYPSIVNVKYVLNGHLLAFEEWDERNNWYGKVAFKASLSEPSTQRVIWQGKFEHLQPVAKKIPAAVVEALSLSMKKCLEDLVQALAQEVK
jgi:ABC-type uncharacterized transport system auxiliary subunit